MVFCALQDRKGFLWFGTRDGLNKYDGYKFTVYRNNPNDTNSLSGNSVVCLFEDSKGNLWVGMGTGELLCLDRETEHFTRYIDSTNEARPYPFRDPISAICEDKAGDLWLTAWPSNIGLRKLRPSTGKYIYYHPNKHNPYSIIGNVTYVCRDSSDVTWVSSAEDGLNRYDEKNDRFINKRTNSKYGEEYTGKIEKMWISANGNFWTANTSAQTSKLILINNSFQKREFSPDIPIPPNATPVVSIVKACNGFMWAGIRGIGLYIFNQQTGESYTYQPTAADVFQLGNINIQFLYKDRDDNIWIGTDVGVHKVHQRSIAVKHFEYRLSNTAILQNIRSIYKDRDSILWIGTGGAGIIRADKTRWNVYRAKGKRYNTVNTIYQDKDSVLWLGTNAGLQILRKEPDGLQQWHFSFTQEQRKSWAIDEWRVWSVLEDTQNNLWLGTLRQGLYKLNKGRNALTPYFNIYERLGTPADSSNNWLNDGAFCITQDSKQNLWFGTNQGLYKLDASSQQFSHYYQRKNEVNSLSYNHVWYIHETSDGILWLATSGGGLNRFDPVTEQFTHFTQADGLPSNIICAILEDKHGNLWISTNKGLACFTPKTKKVRTFGISDGIYISEFHFKTCFQDADGSMYFGGTGGYVHFHPDSIIANNHPPNMAFTGFKVFDKELELDTVLTYKKIITLSHANNFFTAEFAALDFSNPLKNKYRYKLEGVDEQWRETDGSRPYASYTNVAPGKYTLRVQGSNSDEIWNKKGIYLTVVIEPAWWQTLWFKVVILLFVILLVVSGVWWRYRSLQRRNEVERKLVESQLQSLRSQMNPHFIFNSLNSILHFITSNEPETAHTFLSKFSKLIRAILEQSKDEFIPLSEELYVLELYLELEALRFDNRFSYSITVDQSIDIEEQLIPPMLLQPHIENAIKHGLIHTVSEGKIEVLIRRDDHGVICSVIDNGIGRKRSQSIRSTSLHKHQSRGTALTQDRLDILNTLHSQQYGITIEDLTDDKGSARGTRVDIRIASDIGDTHE